MFPETGRKGPDAVRRSLCSRITKLLKYADQKGRPT